MVQCCTEVYTWKVLYHLGESSAYTNALPSLLLIGEAEQNLGNSVAPARDPS